MQYGNENVGLPTDAEAGLTGDGTVIALLKRIRTTLLALLAASAFVFVGTRLAVDADVATATAAAPTYGEGANVHLSTDLAGNLRTSGGGGGGGNPTGGWLDSVRRVGRMDSVSKIDSIRSIQRVLLDSAFVVRWFGSTAPTVGQKTMANSIPFVIASDQTAVATTTTLGAADSVQLRTGMKHAGRVAVDSILANMTHVGRVTVDSILANMTHVGRVAVDSLLTSNNHIGRVAIDTIFERSAVDRNGVGANVSLGSRIGKTQALVTGTLTTTATTADQVVLTRTTAAADTFYITYVVMSARLTTLSATASILGTMSVELPSGTKVITLDFTNPTTSHLTPTVITFPEPISASAGQVVRCVTTPAAATSMLWRCNFGGYEK